MITPNDQDLIIAMVGPEFAQDPPSKFVIEYGIRFGMMCRAGASHNGLGHLGVMHLIREFDISPKGKPVLISVNDWNQVPSETPVMYQGRRGVFRGSSGEGLIQISLDGQKANIEVVSKEVTLTKPLIADVPDEVFDKDPEDAPSPKALLLEDASSKKPEEPYKDDLLDSWGDIDSGSRVIAHWRGKDVDAEFIDLGEGDEIVLLINDTRRTLHSSKVRLPKVEVEESNAQ